VVGRQQPGGLGEVAERSRVVNCVSKTMVRLLGGPLLDAPTALWGRPGDCTAGV